MNDLAIIWTDFKPIGGIERGLFSINDRPLVEYVLESVPDEVESIVLSVKSEREAELYTEVAEKYLAKLHVSRGNAMVDEISDVITEEGTDSFLLLPCDAPLLNKEFTSFLLHGSKSFSAVIPRSSEDVCYYMFSSYNSSEFMRALEATSTKQIGDVVAKMHNVLFVNLNALRVFDERLYMLLRVNNTSDAKKAERILKQAIL